MELFNETYKHLFLCVLYIIMLKKRGRLKSRWPLESVERVYHPYVLPFEAWIMAFSSRKEWRWLMNFLQRIAYGTRDFWVRTLKVYLWESVTQMIISDYTLMKWSAMDVNWSRGGFGLIGGALFELQKRAWKKDSLGIYHRLTCEKEFGRAQQFNH